MLGEVAVLGMIRLALWKEGCGCRGPASSLPPCPTPHPSPGPCNYFVGGDDSYSR